MSSLPPEKRSEAEKQWVALQPYLQAQGFQLRPRYHPQWVPSWSRNMKDYREHEDSIRNRHHDLLDAVRMKDRHQVMIKKLVTPADSRDGSTEYKLLRYFSSASTNEVTNHVVPCYDSFIIPSAPGMMFVTMPLLSRFDFPPFHSLDEVQNFLQQVIEGIVFMHAHNVAHGNIRSQNIMMDSRPLYAEPFHPVDQQRSLDARRSIHPQYRRSQVAVNYYIIGLQYATWFKDSNSSAPRLTTAPPHSNPTPEQRSGRPYDPFAVDIFQLGEMLRLELIPRIIDLEFILPIVNAMVARDPAKRPSAKQVLQMINSKFQELWGILKRRPLAVREPFMLHDGYGRIC